MRVCVRHKMGARSSAQVRDGARATLCREAPHTPCWHPEAASTGGGAFDAEHGACYADRGRVRARLHTLPISTSVSETAPLLVEYAAEVEAAPTTRPLPLPHCWRVALPKASSVVVMATAWQTERTIAHTAAASATCRRALAVLELVARDVAATARARVKMQEQLSQVALLLVDVQCAPADLVGAPLVRLLSRVALVVDAWIVLLRLLRVHDNVLFVHERASSGDLQTMRSMLQDRLLPLARHRANDQDADVETLDAMCADMASPAHARAVLWWCHVPLLWIGALLLPRPAVPGLLVPNDSHRSGALSRSVSLHMLVGARAMQFSRAKLLGELVRVRMAPSVTPLADVRALAETAADHVRTCEETVRDAGAATPDDNTTEVVALIDALLPRMARAVCNGRGGPIRW